MILVHLLSTAILRVVPCLALKICKSCFSLFSQQLPRNSSSLLEWLHVVLWISWQTQGHERLRQWWSTPSTTRASYGGTEVWVKNRPLKVNAPPPKNDEWYPCRLKKNNNSAFSLTPMQLFIPGEAYTDDFWCDFVAQNSSRFELKAMSQG